MLLKFVLRLGMKLHVFLYRRSGGKTWGSMNGVPVMLLTTIGRKTGLQRTTPVLYLTDGPNYVISASNGGRDSHPAWWDNLQSQPRATIEVGSTTQTVTARPASHEEKTRLWAELVARAPIFEGYQKTTTRDIPMVILSPV